jgi:hypothetical protein
MYFDRFDICAAYYFYLSETHEGQFSTKYKRLCKLLRYFKPTACIKVDNLSENGKAIYDNLMKSYLPPF